MARSSKMIAGAPSVAKASSSSDLHSMNAEPMLAVAASGLPPDDAKWSYEIKWDGVRALFYWDGRRLQLRSRNLLDVTRRYPELVKLAEALGENRPTILDGEIVALDPVTGNPSFARLQRRMHVEDPAATQLPREIPVFYILFDVLHVLGHSTLALPYQHRRELLESLITDGPSWQISPVHHGGGVDLLMTARKYGLEGIIAKRSDSPYQSGRRSPDWMKIKLVQGQEFVIGGWVPDEKSRKAADPGMRVGCLLLGYYERQAPGGVARLRYAGSVGSGYSAAMHGLLAKLLRERRVDRNPFVEKVTKRDAIYVTPELVAAVEFLRWEKGGHVYQATFKGLRADIDAAQVVKEDGSGCPS